MAIPECSDRSFEYDVTGVARYVGVIRWLVQGRL